MPNQDIKLGVNIDHVATLRQARGTSYPDPVDAAMICANAGAHGITVHLREDRRHIQDADVEALKAAVAIPLNLEMANAPEIVAFAAELLPDEVCLVPERREELTTEGGLDAAGSFDALKPTVERLGEAGIVVSLFIDPEREQVEAAKALGAPVIELHTGKLCEAAGVAAEAELKRLVAAAEHAGTLGLVVNAGHGIHLGNVMRILEIPGLNTLNIGHSIVARAVLIGLEAAVKEMLHALNGPVGGAAQP